MHIWVFIGNINKANICKNVLWTKSCLKELKLQSVLTENIVFNSQNTCFSVPQVMTTVEHTGWMKTMWYSFLVKISVLDKSGHGENSQDSFYSSSALCFYAWHLKWIHRLDSNKTSLLLIVRSSPVCRGAAKERCVAGPTWVLQSNEEEEDLGLAQSTGLTKKEAYLPKELEASQWQGIESVTIIVGTEETNPNINSEGQSYSGNGGTESKKFPEHRWLGLEAQGNGSERHLGQACCEWTWARTT